MSVLTLQKITEKATASELKDDAHVLVSQTDNVNGTTMETLRRVPVDKVVANLKEDVAQDVADLKSDLTNETNARILLAGRVTTAEGDIDTLETHKVAQPLDEYNQPTDGTDGQLLRTKGDGTTEWVDVGLPTDEQTADAVSAWLDEHPEATTTVQDGSLTEAKLSDSLKLKTIKDYVTPEMFGAKGDGVTDDTIAIQNAINSGKEVRLRATTYLVSTLYLTRGTMICGQGKISKLTSSGNVFEIDPDITYLQNVVLSDFMIEGDKGLYFNNSTYDAYAIRIENITFSCSDTCIYVVKGFQWFVNNVWLTGEKGIVGILGSGCTFMNIYEANCQYMFVNCNGLFISLNTSNSQTTDVVFDYTDNIYGHNIVLVNPNFENVRGKIIQNLTTNGFSNIAIIGLNVINYNADEYLFDIANALNIFINVRNIDPINTLTKFINMKDGIKQIKSFYINANVPFSLNGAAIPIPHQTMSYDAAWRYPFTKFSGVYANLIRGNLTPLQEDIALAYTMQLNSGTFANITSGSGHDLAQLRPFRNATTGQHYLGIGSIITIRNSTGDTLNLGSAALDYTFESSSRMTDGSTKSFILQHNGTRLVWHEI